MQNKLISCLMPTYYRFPNYRNLVEESIESFLRQDYQFKELIVLNDCPGQKIEFTHPKVIVINTNRRFRTLGEKINSMAALSSGEFLCLWEDDDISLPHRLHYSIKKIEDFEYWRPHESWVLKHKLTYNTSIERNCHYQAIFRRSIFDDVGGYPHNSFQLGEQFENLLEDNYAKTYIEKIPMEDWIYIYRKNHRSYHTSSNKHMFDNIGKIEITEGVFSINPHWTKNYVSMTKQLAREAKLSRQIENE